MDLRGKVVVVTGGAKRVGREIVIEVERAGVNVVIHCRTSQAEAAATGAAVRALGAQAAVISGDLGDSVDVGRLATEAYAAYGRVDALMNSASVFWATPIDTLTDEQGDRTLAVNLKGPFLLAKAGVMRRGQTWPLHLTLSCVQPSGRLRCGICAKCAERQHGFACAATTAPARYRSSPGRHVGPPTVPFNGRI